jgi:cytochrome P450
MGDLVFGEPMYMLDNDQYSPWVAAIFNGMKALTILQLLQFFPLLNRLWIRFLPQFIKDQENELFKVSDDRVDRRLAKETDRPDIWTLTIPKEEGDKGLTLEEMHRNAPLFMIGGTETTGTTLSGLTYYLLMNPKKLEILVKEIRDAFPTLEDINIQTLPKLKYLHYCLEEALRLYPPVPGGQARATPPEGAHVAGRDVPGNVSIEYRLGEVRLTEK